MRRSPSTAGWFQLVVGIAVIAWWALAAATNGIPELEDGRTDIVFHIAAELVMAWLLIAAGFSVLRRGITPRTTLLSGLALGALAYSSINSPGYFAEQRSWWAVGMFAAIGATAALTALSIGGSAARSERSDDGGAPAVRSKPMSRQRTTSSHDIPSPR